MDRESSLKSRAFRLKRLWSVCIMILLYRKKMQELGSYSRDDINSIDDIVKLPFTTKYDFAGQLSLSGLCVVPMSQT